MKRTGGQIFLGILSGFASVILSIVFVVVAFALPVYYSVAGMLQPKTITTVIQNIDYVEIIEQSTNVNQAIEKLGIDSKVTDEVIKSKEVGKLLEDCTEKITDVLGDSAADLSQLDSAFLQGLVDEHIDDILKVVEEKTESPIVKEDLKAGVNKFIEENEASIEETVLELEPVKQAIVRYETVTQTVQKTLKWHYALGLGLALALILGLIYFLRKRNYGGFIWIAVDTGIAGALVSGMVVIISSGIIKEAIADMPGFASGIVESAVGAALTKLTIALVVCFVIMAASIVACVLLRQRAKKNAEISADEPTEALPEETV